jgi:uncharacterized protein (DUF486 family)
MTTLPPLWQTIGLLAQPNAFMTYLWASICIMGAVYFIFRS